MHPLFDFFIPGNHYYNRKWFFLGDIINLMASICAALGTYHLYANQLNESIIYFTLLSISLIINIWQILGFRHLSKNPAFLKHQEHEFREVISNYLQQNNKETITQLEKIINKTPHAQELEIFMVHLLQRSSKDKESQKLASFLKKQQLSNAARSLLFSIKKKK